MNQRVRTLTQTIVAETEGRPLFIRAMIPTGTRMLIEGGVANAQYVEEDYVLLSVLPQDLRERVRLCVQQLLKG